MIFQTFLNVANILFAYVHLKKNNQWKKQIFSVIFKPVVPNLFFGVQTPHVLFEHLIICRAFYRLLTSQMNLISENKVKLKTVSKFQQPTGK
jgi:hypothetical protein